MKRSSLLFLLPLLVVSCGGGGDNDVSAWTDLIGRSWSTAAAVSDSYECTGLKVAQDMYITGFRTQAASTSAGGTYRVMLGVDDNPTPTLGDFDCDAGVLSVNLIYASGLETDELRFPAGVAVHVKAGQNLLLNVHLVTPAASSGSTRIQVLTGAPVDAQHEVDMTFAGTTNISIVSDGKPHQTTGGCAAQSDTNIFAMLPLMHGAGTHQAMYLNGVPVLDSDYSPSRQPFHVPASPIAIHQGDQILLTCGYVNNTGGTLIFGESPARETCYNGLYRTPVPASATLYDCVSH